MFICENPIHFNLYLPLLFQEWIAKRRNVADAQCAKLKRSRACQNPIILILVKKEQHDLIFIFLILKFKQNSHFCFCILDLLS